MESNNAKPVLVTGATGYIASFLIKLLLEKGHTVRGTIRSLASKEKYGFLMKLDGHERLELVEADLMDENSWDKAVTGCDFVFHVASPIPPYIPKDQNEIIVPAVNGTKFVVSACIRHKVKRVIVTSSCLTIFEQENKPLTEENWADPNKIAHYPKSKVLAERCAWELYNKQDLKGQHTELVTVLPSLVLGPTMTVHGGASEGLIAEIIKGGFPGYIEPEVVYTFVDVRDVATGHYRAMFTPEAAGQRITVANAALSMKEMFTILKGLNPSWPITIQPISVEEIKQKGSPIAQRSTMLSGKRFIVDNTKSVNLLKMQYIGAEKSLKDMAAQLEALGVLNK